MTLDHAPIAPHHVGIYELVSGALEAPESEAKYFEARCSCGWVSDARTTFTHAHNDGSAHHLLEEAPSWASI